MSQREDASAAELHRLAVELAPCGLLVVDAGGRMVMVNRAIEAMFGYSSGELLGQAVEILIPEEARDGHPALRQAYFATPEARPMGAGRDLRGRRKDGSEFVVEVGLSPMEVDSEAMVLASVVDVTERKRAEARFHAVVESSPSAMLMVDPDGRIALVNEEVERLFGWSRGELLGRPMEMLVPERYRSAHPGHRALFNASPAARPMGRGRELFGRRQDGSEVPIEIGLRPLPTDEGLFVLSSIVDISERKRADQRLRDSEERFRSLADGIRDQALVMLDAGGRVEVWNAGAEILTAHRLDDVLGRELSFLFTQEERAAGEPGRSLERARSEGRIEAEGWRLRADGTRFLAHSILSPVGRENAAEPPRGFALVFRDVTADRKLDEHLRQTQKSEAIGTLASGIAHDFNNILLGIQGHSELALDDRVHPELVLEHLDQVLSATRRGARLVARILAFSKGTESVLAPVDPKSIVRETVELLRASLPASIEIRDSYLAAAPEVLGDETQLQQVVMNLATNAAQAMLPRGGSLAVDVGLVDVDAARAASNPGLSPGLHVRIAVSDEGPGILPELGDRIFDPFFTTKPPGQGTGLGLSAVKAILRSHAGAVHHAPRPDGGTVFEVLLPVATSPLRDEPIGVATSAVLPAEARKRSILLVEDETELAALAKRQIERAGYEVSVYTSSLAALAAFRQNPHRHDALVTDNTMPRMNGLELAQAMLAIRPDLPVLMVSGLATVVSLESLRERGIREVLGKPYVRDELYAALDRLFASERSN